MNLQTATNMAMNNIPLNVNPQQVLRASQIVRRNPYADEFEKVTLQGQIADLKNIWALNQTAEGSEQTADRIARQNAAAEQANIIRQYARDNNIDIGAGFDSTGEGALNANQAAAQYALNLNAAQRKILDAETPDQFYNRRVNEYMQSGVKEKNARAKALNEYYEYAANRMADWQSLYHDYGTNGGMVNDTGALLLSMIGKYSPEQANALYSMYASPKDEYQYNQKRDFASFSNELNRENARLNALLGNDKLMLQSRLGMEAANNNFANQRALQNDRFLFELDKSALDNATKADIAQTYINAGLAPNGKAAAQSSVAKAESKAVQKDDALFRGVGNAFRAFTSNVGDPEKWTALNDAINKFEQEQQSDNGQYAADIQRIKIAGQLHKEIYRLNEEGTSIDDQSGAADNAGMYANYLVNALDDNDIAALGFDPYVLRRLANNYNFRKRQGKTKQ